MFHCPSVLEPVDICISEMDLCNGRYDCPQWEDEDLTMCMYYRAVSFDANPNLSFDPNPSPNTIHKL